MSQGVAESRILGVGAPALRFLRGVKRCLARFATPIISASASMQALRENVRELERANEDLRRQVALLRGGAERIHCRPGTHDERIWNQVVHGNEYRLPDSFDFNDVVIDIGTHIGAFSFSCLVRGAGRVLSFEPNASNFGVARKNLARFGARSEVQNRAVWRSDAVRETLFYIASPDPANTGGGAVVQEALTGGRAVEWIGLDSIIDDLRQRTGVERIRLLKLDCEGGEYAILLTSRRLHLVDAVCGEYHEIGCETPIEGVSCFDRHAVKGCLEQQGFTVELESDASTPNLGLFFARRK